MRSSVPIVRQVAWVSVIPQLVVGLLLIAGAYAAGFEDFVLAGLIGYLTLSMGLKR